jgi:hypothetical protein
MFTVGSGFTLILDNNITLRGGWASVVSVQKDGKLIMNNGSTVTGNTESFERGGVSVSGIFTMNGGTISGNRGSGVRVSGGTFTMNGGTISGNKVGGVNMQYGGTFTMSGGKIFGNTATGDRGALFITKAKAAGYMVPLP